MVGRIAPLLLVLLACSPAIAQEVTEDRDREGRSLFEAGVASYEAGRYEDALNHFRAAYEASRRSALLYNIGQAADHLRRDDEALEAFEQYLREVPDASNRRMVEGRIAAIREAQARQGGSSSSTGGGSGADGGGVPVGPIVVTAVGVALVGAGIAMVVVAGNEAEAVNTAPDGSRWVDYEGSAALAEPLSLAGQVITIAGAAAAAAGLVWLVVELAGSSSGSEPEVALEASGLGLSLRARL